MKLDNTIIISADSSALAKKLFNSLIYEEDVIVALVLGSDEQSQQVVQIVDKRAKPVVNSFARKVGWIMDRSTLKNDIIALKSGSADISKEDLSNVLIIFITLDNKISKIMRKEDEINFLTVDMAFLEAGKK
jgi:tRNA pseudouridine-54 N-methylase